MHFPFSFSLHVFGDFITREIFPFFPWAYTVTLLQNSSSGYGIFVGELSESRLYHFNFHLFASQTRLSISNRRRFRTWNGDGEWKYREKCKIKLFNWFYFEIFLASFKRTIWEQTAISEYCKWFFIQRKTKHRLWFRYKKIDTRKDFPFGSPSR